MDADPKTTMGAVEEDLRNRWREGPWCCDPRLHHAYAPIHVKEAFYFGWSKHFAVFPVRTVTGKWRWMRTVLRRQVHGPAWFLNGVSWQEYRDVR